MSELIKHKNTQENRSILKSIGIFGSMRFLQMLAGLIVSKFVAIFIGPSGIGLLGLLKNVINLITSITSFGFATTSIKEIATPLNDKDQDKLQIAIYVSKRTSIYIGIIGAIVSIIFNGMLSKWVFDDYSKFYLFLVLSLNFFFLAKNSYYIALMQGMRLTKVIATSGVFSALLGGVVTLPIYYFFKEEGIVPAIVMANLVSLLVNIFLTKKVKQTSYDWNFRTYFDKAKPMLSLGLYLSINIIFGHLCHFLIKLFFNNYIDDQSVLGFYEVGVVIVSTYAGTIFAVMSIDFYPKLTSFQHDNAAVKDLANKQIVIGILIVTPLIIFFSLFDKWLILILYSKEFAEVSSILKIGLFSTIIKSIIWPLSFIILAKGNKSQYLKQELLGDFLNVSSTVILYLKLGLLGVGLAMCLNFIIYGVYLYLYVKKQYNFSFTKSTNSIVVTCLLLGTAVSFINLLQEYSLERYILVGVVLLISVVFSLKKINQQMDLWGFLSKRVFKN